MVGSNLAYQSAGVQGAQGSDDQPRHRRLNLLRIIKGLVCLLVLLSTAFAVIVFFGVMTGVILRFFSVHYSRKATSIVVGAWLSMWPFLFEQINMTKVVFSGQSVPSRERVLLISNHITEVDWMYLWNLALRKGSLGYVKYVLKNSLMKLPVFGWAFHILEFIPVERKWEADESNMHRMLSSFKDRHDPLWLAIFPEGTDFSEEKCVRSQEFAAKKNLPILKNVLLPKSKGFHACLKELRDSLDAVYDVTIAYKHRSPSLLDNIFGMDPSEVHIHVRRVSIKNSIPRSEEMVAAWLNKTFAQKDELLSEFYRQGHFPRQGVEVGLSLEECLINLVAMLLLTGGCIYLTIFSSIWFGVYACLSCCYLASATYFNIRTGPIFCEKAFTWHVYLLDLITSFRC